MRRLIAKLGLAAIPFCGSHMLISSIAGAAEKAVCAAGLAWDIRLRQSARAGRGCGLCKAMTHHCGPRAL
jgi:hypothetical protein